MCCHAIGSASPDGASNRRTGSLTQLNENHRAWEKNTPSLLFENQGCVSYSSRRHNNITSEEKRPGKDTDDDDGDAFGQERVVLSPPPVLSVGPVLIRVTQKGCLLPCCSGVVLRSLLEDHRPRQTGGDTTASSSLSLTVACSSLQVTFFYLARASRHTLDCDWLIPWYFLRTRRWNLLLCERIIL